MRGGIKMLLVAGIVLLCTGSIGLVLKLLEIKERKTTNNPAE
jgi:preprotein translocase subunit Sss1